MKIKVGIFFGGPSREREISFAGGRTVYDNLNKSIFEPIPIFVDSHKNFILLDWQYIYKGSIRDFYPPVDRLPESPNGFQVYLESMGDLSDEQQAEIISSVGQSLSPEDLANKIDIAFLALHGVYGEDGQLQKELQDLGIPYTGSGIRASQIGMDKAVQKELMGQSGFPRPKVQVISKAAWFEGDADELYQSAISTIGFPMVIRPANQGSSIGVSIIDEEEGLSQFEHYINRAFFRELILTNDWSTKSQSQKIAFIRDLTDIRHGLGFPLNVKIQEETQTLYHPEALLTWLDEACAKSENENTLIELNAHLDEEKVIIEEFIDGREFSCIVVRKEESSVVALPPTEIKKGKEVFDYRSKYLPGLSRKVTPIDLSEKDINAIRSECERLFTELDFQTYARIDGFIKEDGTIFLNDPNTTSGMLPSSFFFHQAAEIGLNPSQFLTYIIRISLQERNAELESTPFTELLLRLDAAIISLKAAENKKRRIGVILGGYSFERHISVESGRNIFEKLASSEKYEPIPIFLSGSDNDFKLYQLPINLLLKDNADDIRDKIATYAPHPVVEEIKTFCASITEKYASDQIVFEPQELSFDQLKEQVDGVFIALHGRPGEDGQLQMQLEARNIPYNGSGIDSSKTTINKYETLQKLKEHGFEVAEQMLASAKNYQEDPQEFYARIESRYTYPFIAKPVDDGCSSAVQVIRKREELEAYVRMMFRPEGHPGTEARRTLGLTTTEEFPRKGEILFENLIDAKGAKHFMEITGGLLTHFDPNGGLQYQAFEPSETLATKGVLSLEEKFLAGEGQNITPARFSDDVATAKLISSKVKADLEKVARILQIEGYARIDAFVRIYEDNRVETVVIEVNSLPGMTPATCIFHQAALRDYKPYEFIDRILTFAFQRQQMKPAAPVEKPVAEEKLAETKPTVATTTVAAPSEKEESKAVKKKEITLPPPPIEKPSRSPKPSNGNGTFERIKYFFSWLGNHIWNFIKSTIFLRNLGAIVILLVALFYLTTIWLDTYTKHGQSVEVQEYIDLRIEQAKRKAERRSFSLVILDSVWVPNRPGGIVYSQTPEPGSRVKKNRRIYVKVTKVKGDTKKLPPFKDSGYDFFNYQRRLRSMNVRATIKDREFSGKLAENSILHFYYKGEKITDKMVAEGFEVPQGAELEFVITQRQMNQVPIPNLVCKRYEAATFILSSNNLVIGRVIGEVDDRNSAFIWKQDPAYQAGTMIPTGQAVDIYLMNVRPSGCQEELDPSQLDEVENQEGDENFDNDPFESGDGDIDN